MTYLEALQNAINCWNSDPITDEWCFEKFRKEHSDKMSPHEAFQAVDDTVPFLINELDESTACEILQTILILSLKTETTELPKKLDREMESIETKFSEFGEYSRSKLSELKKHYRLS